jgi:hypothetical protein
MGNPGMQLMRGPNGEVMMPPGMMQVCVRVCYRCITGLCDGSEHYTIVSERTSRCGGCAFVCTGELGEMLCICSSACRVPRSALWV